METIEGFSFQPITCDRDGQLEAGADELAAHVKDHQVSDVIVICHGFRNDENDARRWYSNFLKTFKDNCQRGGAVSALAGRKFAVGGVFWPSMVLPEPNDGEAQALSAGTGNARERLARMKAGAEANVADRIDAMLDELPMAEDDQNARLRMATSLLEIVRSVPSDDGNEARAAFANATPEALCNVLMAGENVAVAPTGSTGGVGGIPQLAPQGETGASLSVVGKVLGFVPQFVNLTTFLLMFHRCGDVGAKGISQVVRRVRGKSPARIHLVGHSLGGRAVTACAKALLDAPAQHVETMMLLEAAYSHFGLSKAGTTANGISHPRGFFRDVIEKQVVRGPILATYSSHDSVVGFAYTAMAAVSGNNAKAIGNDRSPFGGIGRNGVLDATEASRLELAVAGGPYTFSSGSIYNLDGSRSVDGAPLIRSHGDVTNPAVTWAFACLLATA